MKIIIDIPEEEYKDLTQTGENTINLGVLLALREAVRNGATLPKNHGRLIDADELSKGLIERWNTADNNAEKQISQVIANVVTPIVVSTPTIIPAEREEEWKHQKLK